MRCGSVRNITASTSANTEAATPAPPTCCACWADGPPCRSSRSIAARTGFALDVLKGFVAVALLGLLKYDDNISDIWLINLKIIAVFAAVLGHIFPVFAHFKGGKGVATLVGAVLGIHPITVLLCFGIWFIVLMITHYVSLSSMIAGCCFPIFVLLSPKINHSVPLVVFSFVIAALLIWTHRKNIDRLKKGTESKIYIWRPVASRRRNDPDK